MKRWGTVLLIMILMMGLLLAGCTEKTEQPQQSEPVQQEEQQTEEQRAQDEISTLVGEFIGLADSHSVEILIDGEACEFQVVNEDIRKSLEVFDSGIQIQFDVMTDAETGTQTIVKIYDTPAQG